MTSLRDRLVDRDPSGWPHWLTIFLLNWFEELKRLVPTGR